ncbi:SPBC776.05 [Symbiodinium necroappetens]|uniref:SPBC776.05 protein n=1 Tax=Symbiodinium necroappetens TaxID=1628268 RepID=A0A812NEH5_9DINO|nr:SPBC776.05 [Symbiodinium necroappetens]
MNQQWHKQAAKALLQDSARKQRAQELFEAGLLFDLGKLIHDTPVSSASTPQSGGKGTGKGKGKSRPSTRTPWADLTPRPASIFEDGAKNPLSVISIKVAHAAAKGVFLAGVGEFESFLDITSNSPLAMLVPQTPKVRSILQSRGVAFAERLVALHDPNSDITTPKPVFLITLGGSVVFAEATPDAQFEVPVPTVEVAIDIEIDCIDPCMQREVDKNARYAFKQIVHAAFSEQIVSECYSVFVRASVLQGIIKIPVSQLINVLRRSGPDGIFAKEKWRAQPVQLPLALIHQSQLREKNWDTAVKAASELSGFAGIHRSATGSKSLRFDDKGIAKAREVLCVSGLYSDDNISVVATHFFQVQGIPSGTTAAALCAGLRQWGWTVIPVKSWPLSPTHAIWLVGSATEPPGEFLILQDVTVTVVKDGPSTRQSTTPSKSVPVDPLQVQTVVESRIVDAEKRLADQMQSMLTSARLEFQEQLDKLRQDQASVMQMPGPQTDVDARITSAEQRITDQMQTTFQSMRQEFGQQCETLRQEQASSSKLLADTVSHVRHIEANVVSQVQDLKTQQAGTEERLLAAIASSGAKPSPSRKAPRAT